MIPATWREAERVCGECATRCKLVGAGTARGRGLCRGRGAPVCERCPRGHDRPAGPPTVKLHVVRNYKSFIPDRRPAKQNFMFVEPNIRATSHLWIHTRYTTAAPKKPEACTQAHGAERERGRSSCCLAALHSCVCVTARRNGAVEARGRPRSIDAVAARVGRTKLLIRPRPQAASRPPAGPGASLRVTLRAGCAMDRMGARGAAHRRVVSGWGR